MAVVTLHVDAIAVAVPAGVPLLQALTAAGVQLPTLCHHPRLSPVAACRLCLVELEGASRPVPACVTAAAEGQRLHTDTPALREGRRLIVELLFAEGNHPCAVCVANGDCELQDAAHAVGMDLVTVPYRHPVRRVDASHPLFLLDHNRCIVCSRCVRVCDEIEGARVWAMAERGGRTRLIAGLDQPWGSVDSCTSCGKCVAVCPTGALVSREDVPLARWPGP
jgi:bidirectional [NiFe] hydrogenase diaphorase subunit